MRHLKEAEEFSFFKCLQRAFYAENVDIADAAAYPELIAGFGVDTQSFMTALCSEEMKKAAWDDVDAARRLTIAGFPSLLLRLDTEHLIVTRGYLPWPSLEPSMTEWLYDRFDDEADSLLAAGGVTPAGE